MNNARRVFDVIVPARFDWADVEVTTEFCNEIGTVLETGPVLKKATPKAKANEPKPKPERSKKWRDRQGPREAIAVPETELNDEHDAGRVAGTDRRWTQEPNSDE